MKQWRGEKLKIKTMPKQKQKVLNTRLTPEGFEALKELGKLYPRDISLTQIASRAIIEKLKAETYV